VRGLRSWIVASVLMAALIGAIGLAARPGQEVMLASYATTLDSRTDNQRHNAELSARRLNGAVVEPGGVLSFVEEVGTWSRDAGYRRAPVSYNGTLIDTWGGGVCQTSTTLYNAGLLAGFEVVERHKHRFAPSYVPPGRDAAVAFSGIDLKLRNPHPYPVRIEASVVGDRLLVSAFGARPLKERPQIISEVRQVVEPQSFNVGRAGRGGKIRNAGKSGFEVATYRMLGDRRMLLSVDSYPAMHRVVEHRQ
jgi:vancomycin resistance protein VanW